MEGVSAYVSAKYTSDGGESGMPGVNKRPPSEQSTSAPKLQRGAGGGPVGRGDGRERRGRGVSSSSQGGSGNSGKGGKGGRGHFNSGNSGEAGASGQDTIQLHGRILARLARAHREDNRYSQLIVNIKSIEERELLSGIAKQWKARRPERGQHPDGELSCAQWLAWLDWLNRQVKHELSTPEQKDWAATVETWSKGTIFAIKAEKGKEQQYRSYVRSFTPIGRKDRYPEEERPWL